MRVARVRRNRLFKTDKPTIRPAVYDDIRWVWTAARRDGFEGTSEEFTREYEPILAEADRLFMLEDRNWNFETKEGPVGLVMANYDGWTLVPHVEWFPWATTRNKLRCTVGFLQAMRYTHDIGSIKILADEQHTKWFKALKRYISISLIGRIPGGRPNGDEVIFHLRGRKKHGQYHENTVRRVKRGVEDNTKNHSSTATSNS